MRSRLKYNLEDKMSRIKVGKGFEGNKDQITDNIMKIFRIFIPMIVSTMGGFSFCIEGGFFKQSILGFW
jgi:hypothetical protein